MSIINSVILADVDSWVFEEHTDSIGAKHSYRYHAAVTDDRNALLAVHAAELETVLANAEFDQVINGG